MAKIELPYNSVLEAYEGNDPELFTEFTGKVFNTPHAQLLANVKQIVDDINEGKAGGAVELVTETPDPTTMNDNTWYIEVE